MDANEFTARIAALGINRAEVARRLGIHEASVLRMSSGHLNVPQYVVLALANLEKLQQAGIAPARSNEPPSRGPGRPPGQTKPDTVAPTPRWASPTTKDGARRRMHNVTSLASIVVQLADKLDVVERQLAQLGAQQAATAKPKTSAPTSRRRRA